MINRFYNLGLPPLNVTIFNTHVRNCVMGARPMKYNLWCVNIHCQSFIFDPLANIEDRDVLLPAENTARIQMLTAATKVDSLKIVCKTE